MVQRLERFKSGQVIKGRQFCNHPDCEKEFTWVFQNGGRNYEVIEVYKLKNDEERLVLLDKETLDARCYCSHCQRMNFFKAKFD